MTGPSAPGGGPADGRTRQAGIALALCLFALLALTAPVAGRAQERDKTPAPERLWKAFPLDPRASPSARPAAASSPARARSEPVAVSRQDGGGGVPVVLLGLLALLAAGGTMTLLRIRRPRERAPSAALALTAPRLVGRLPSIAAPSRARSGRFARATTRPSAAQTVEAIATAASASDPARGAAGASGKPPAPLAAAQQAGGDSSPPTPVAASPFLAPPDPTRAWTAEIEWRHTGDGSRFCVVARGGGTITLAQSPPLEWPPVGPAAVQAMTDAPEKLGAALTAAGWKTLPPGSAWYAKRFAWEPVDAERPAAPVEPTAAAGATSGHSDATGASRLLRRPELRIALLFVLVALGPLAALLLSGGGGPAPAGKPTPSATAQPKPKPAGSDGIDLTIPVLVVLGGISIGLAIRQSKRQR